jgi:hypothetical protein
MKKMNLISSIAVLSLVVACSGSSSSTANKANVEGSVTSSTALKVSVPGSSQSATTDASGNFALIGVPSGATSLHFTGTGVDATLPIVALMAGEDRHIAASVSGNTADDHPERDGSRFTGTVQSITAPTLTISGVTVTTTSATAFTSNAGTAITLDSIAIGDFVEVEGAPQADGSVIARSIKQEDQELADGGEPGDDNGHDDAGDDHGGGSGNGTAQFEGSLTAISGTTLTIGGVTVTTTAATEIEGANETHIALSALTVGEELEVKGVAQADGSVAASKIELQGAGDADLDDQHITGAVVAVDATLGSVTIGTTTVLVTATTRFEGLASLSAVTVGELLDIEATAAADGTLTATEIKAQAALAPPFQTEVRGPITALDATTVTVASKTFTVNASTRMDNNGDTFTLASLKTGQTVDVRGSSQTVGGALVASRIQLRN